jgi:hypothetical protein
MEVKCNANDPLNTMVGCHRRERQSARTPTASLLAMTESAKVCHMTAVAEIESAIERLSPAEVKELAAWLEEYQQMINASAETFSMYEREEGGQ